MRNDEFQKMGPHQVVGSGGGGNESNLWIPILLFIKGNMVGWGEGMGGSCENGRQGEREKEKEKKNPIFSFPIPIPPLFL